MDELTRDVLDHSRKILRGEIAHSFFHLFPPSRSARCLEVPWMARQLKVYDGRRILDIGFSLASLDCLGVLLELKKRHHRRVEGVDIIDPVRVDARYPDHWRASILSVPVHLGDVRRIDLPGGRYDVVTCISALEHVGYDMPSRDDPLTAFAREKDPARVNTVRDPSTERRVMDKIHHWISPGGILLISVPMGAGGPVILRDSLGYYCVQWEYEAESWQRIAGHQGFEVVAADFFRLTPELRWVRVTGAEDLSHLRAAENSHSNGCALAVLRKKRP